MSVGSEMLWNMRRSMPHECRADSSSSSSSLISALLHAHVTFNLEWCDKNKLSNLLTDECRGSAPPVET